MPKDRNKLIPGAYVIPIKEGQVLLLRRYNTGYNDGNYSFIGGHVDKNQTFIQAAVKEAKEEAGIGINPDDLKFVHALHRKDDGERVDIFFSVANWTGEITNMEPSKCDDLSWFGIENLPNNVIPWIKQVIERIGSPNYSEWDKNKS